jgi:hypothetical protein
VGEKLATAVGMFPRRLSLGLDFSFFSPLSPHEAAGFPVDFPMSALIVGHFQTPFSKL